MIIFCVVFAGVCVIPYLVDFKEITESLDLWVPHKSDQYQNAKWLEKNYPSTTRFSVVLLTTEEDTILTRENIQKLIQIHQQINSLSSTGGVTWNQVCTKWPNPWTKEPECAENSLLEVWAKNGSYASINQTIWTKTNDQILDDVNSIRKSGIFNVTVSLNLYLGSIKEENSKVLSAKALQITMQSEIDQTNLVESKKAAREFEHEYNNFLDNYSLSNKNSRLRVSYFSMKSIKDATDNVVGGDLNLLSMGFIIVFLYVMTMLGQLNSVEQRACLSLLGIVAIMLGTAMSYGLCQLIGVHFTQMNSILPFMLLGIGIDDMFVIVQGLTNVQKQEENRRYGMKVFGIINYQYFSNACY